MVVQLTISRMQSQREEKKSSIRTENSSNCQISAQYFRMKEYSAIFFTTKCIMFWWQYFQNILYSYRCMNALGSFGNWLNYVEHVYKLFYTSVHICMCAHGFHIRLRFHWTIDFILQTASSGTLANRTEYWRRLYCYVEVAMNQLNKQQIPLASLKTQVQQWKHLPNVQLYLLNLMFN